MNIDQWVLQAAKAYQCLGFAFSEDKESSLLTKLSDKSSDSQKEVVVETLDVMTRFFFQKGFNRRDIWFYQPN